MKKYIHGQDRYTRKIYIQRQYIHEEIYIQKNIYTKWHQIYKKEITLKKDIQTKDTNTKKIYIYRE